LRVVGSSKADGYWRLKVELSEEEASLISTVFGVDICSTEYISVDELTRRLLHSIIANRLRESKSGCEVSMVVSSVWLQSITPAGSYVSEEKQLLDYTVEGLKLTLNAMTSLAKGLEELRKRLVAPCIDPGVSKILNKLLEKLPLLCVRGYAQGESLILEAVIGDYAIPSYSSRISIKVNALPDAPANVWYKGLQSRLEGCIRVESGSKDTMRIGDVVFRSGLYYVNDCIILNAYIDECREGARAKTANIVKLDELKLDEKDYSILSLFLEIAGRENVEVRTAGEQLYLKSLKAGDPLVEAELCLRRRVSPGPSR